MTKKTDLKTTVGIVIALTLLAGGAFWKMAQRTEREAASKDASSEAARQTPSQTAVTPPQIQELPRTARGTRAYVVRNSLGVRELDYAVQVSGVRIVSRLSHAGAIVEATDEAQAKLRACRGVTSVEDCARASKLSPALLERLAKCATGASLRVMIMLVNAVDAATVGERIATAGGRVTSQPNVHSRFAWVGAEVPAKAVDALADLAEVSWIEPQGTLQYSNDVSVRAEELDVRRAWDNVSGLGLTGAGQVIGHADTGLDLGDITRLEPEFAGHVKAIYDHTKGGGVRDTNGHGTHTAGSIVGQGIASLGGKYRGVAYGAMLIHQSLGYELAATPDDLNTLFAEAYRDGARIHSDSWINGSMVYDAAAQSLDEFVWVHPDFLPVFSAGNSGDKANPEVGSPALARNALAVGAASHDGGVASFSSRGLADDSDRRIKPDVLSPGVGIVSVQSMAIRNPTACGDPDAGTRYSAQNGTSMATPLAAGSLALMREWYLREKGKSPTAAMLTAMALGGAAARTGTGVVSDVSGWGCLAVASTLAPTNGVSVRLRDERLEMGAQADFTETFLVTNSSERLVFSLAWLDAPADPRDNGLRVDYDLVVVAPDGTRHWPNGGSAEDHTNPRETVVVTNAATGIWSVTVTSADQCEAGGAAALYARGAFAADTSGAETNVWHVAAGGSIQSVVDRARSGDVIFLEEGTYAPFVASNKLLTVRGKGRDCTVIDGGGTHCAVLLSPPGDPSGTVLEGVTIENGFADYGGGLCGGTLRNATIRNCAARFGGGGACNATLDRCIVSNCAVVATAKPEDFEDGFVFGGGGVNGATLYNCLIADCSVDSWLDEDGVPLAGGGAAQSLMANVTVVGSRLLSVRPAVTYAIGATYDCSLENTLVCGSTLNGTNVQSCSFGIKQCSYVAAVGTNAFVDFAAGDYRLANDAWSAIDAGHTNYVATYPSFTDLAGSNRVSGLSVDLGCYESPYATDQPPAVAQPPLTMNPGSLVGLAIGVADTNNPSLSLTMIDDAWRMTAHEKGLAEADAARSELLCPTVTVSDFLAATDRIVAGIRSGDVVLFSISTHGGDSCDATNGIRTTGSKSRYALSDGLLWPSNVAAFAERLEAKGAKLVQVHEACFAGGFAEMTGLPAVTASTSGETSIGYRDGGFFTSAFLEAWRNPPAGADLNGDGVLSLYELAVATQRTYRGNPTAFCGAECCIFKPDELAKVAMRKLPEKGEEGPLSIITDRMPPAYVNQSYYYQLHADGDSGSIWTALSPLPEGLTLDEDGLVRGAAAWGTVTNFLVSVNTADGRTAETNVVLSGLVATEDSRPRLVSVSVPQGAVTRRRDDGDWTVQVVAESVQAEDPAENIQYFFAVLTRVDKKNLSCVTNTTGVFTLDAETLSSWPDVFVVCQPYCNGRVMSEKNLLWFIRTDVPFPASRAGVCSWSWATNMTTILSEMDTMGVKQMQLSLVPWVKPLYGIDYPPSLRETFGKGETGDVFLSISNKILRGEISVLSTMISFPLDRWTNFAAISNSNGIVCNIDTNDTEGTSVSATDPLGLAAWTVNSNLIDQAAAMTRQLGVDYITTEVGYLDKEMWDGTPRSSANENCNIGMARLYEAHRICAKHGVKMLFESGQYSGARTMELIDIYTNRYANAPFENDYGLTINDIGINYDVANHLIYANDNPTNAFAAMRGRIAQIHVKDTYEDLATRTKICGFAGDVKWGTADVSGKYATLAFLKNEGYEGNLLVEHEWGEDRIGDIKAALQAILLENNDDGSPWIVPQAMTGVTMGECCTAALKANGFSSSVAGALGNMALYNSFTEWAKGKNLAPSNLVSKSGVILAAAFGADAPPVSEEAVTLKVEGIAVGAESTTLEVFCSFHGCASEPANQALLKAAIGIEGTISPALTPFSTDHVYINENAYSKEGRMTVDVMPLLYDPKRNQFFFRAVAR